MSDYTIKVPQKFTFACHREMATSLEKIKAGGTPAEIFLDFMNTSYLDSSALGMLLMWKDKNPDSKLILTNCKGIVFDVLKIANFHKLFTIVKI